MLYQTGEEVAKSYINKKKSEGKKGTKPGNSRSTNEKLEIQASFSARLNSIKVQSALIELVKKLTVLKDNEGDEQTGSKDVLRLFDGGLRGKTKDQQFLFLKQVLEKLLNEASLNFSTGEHQDVLEEFVLEIKRKPLLHILDGNSALKVSLIFLQRLENLQWLHSQCSFQIIRLTEGFLRSKFEKNGSIQYDKLVTDSLSSQESIRFIVDVVSQVANVYKQRQPCPGNSISKFIQGSSKLMNLGHAKLFNAKLETLIGPPRSYEKIYAAILEEHSDNKHFATNSDRSKFTTPNKELRIVLEGFGTGSIPSNHDIPRRDVVHGIDYYVDKYNAEIGNNAPQSEKLNRAEILALRLWTSPMHILYCQSLRSAKIDLIRANREIPFSNTLHAINSGIIKLSRNRKLCLSRTVYRGYSDMRPTLSEKIDDFGCRGGVEIAILATSKDKFTALKYCSKQAQGCSFFMEAELGQVDRGADISWLSEFPHEQEIVFPALSNIEFIGKAYREVTAEGFILVFKIRISANSRGYTLEEIRETPKVQFLNFLENSVRETKETLKSMIMPEHPPIVSATVTSIVDDCYSRFRQHELRPVEDFNEKEIYLQLLEDVADLRSRSVDKVQMLLDGIKQGKDAAWQDGLKNAPLDWLKREAGKLRAQSGVHDFPWEVVLSSSATSVKINPCMHLNPDQFTTVSSTLALNKNIRIIEMQRLLLRLSDSISQSRTIEIDRNNECILTDRCDIGCGLALLIAHNTCLEEVFVGVRDEKFFISDKSLGYLLNVLKINRSLKLTLKRFDLRRCNLTPTQISHIWDEIKHMQRLRDVFRVPVAELISKGNPFLLYACPVREDEDDIDESDDLQEARRLGDDGATALALAIRGNETIEELHIGYAVQKR